MKKKIICSLLAVILCMSFMLTGCSSVTTVIRDALEEKDILLGNTGDYTVEKVDYSNAYERIATAGIKNSSSMNSWGLDYYTKYDEAETIVEDTTSSVQVSSENTVTVSDGYTETNIQVDGVDEGDIVKTDGTYLYVLRDNALYIFKIEGRNTTQLSSITVGSESYYVWETEVNDTENDIGNNSEEEDEYLGSPEEFYIYGDTLAVINNYYGYDENRTAVKLYDVSDRSNPKKITVLGQDGYLAASRRIDNIMYLISSEYVYDPVEDDITSYIPSTYVDGEETVIREDCIWMPKDPESTEWTVISAVDLDTGKIKATSTFMGGAETVYMSTDAIYLADERYVDTTEDPVTEEVYEVVEHHTGEETDLMKIDLSESDLKVTASGSINGSLLNQFSMDESEGYLRVVTSVNSSTYTTYTDKKRDFENYVYGDDIDTNCVFVLDSSLKVVGSITGIAEDERVYSVRFDGNVGYFVTYRETDPLFAVDLSDPTNPTIIGELELPGFSDYMQKYSDNLLFGLGRSVDEETNTTDCLKISMFDVSDPENPKEIAKALIEDEYYSAAEYDHHAILIDAEKGLIGFPGGWEEYYLYRYNESENKFEKVAAIETDEYQGRGIIAGDILYVIGESQIVVYDLTSNSIVKSINF